MLYLIYTETKETLPLLVAEYFSGAHFRQGKGLWKGVLEESTVIEIVADSTMYERDRVLMLVEAIKKTNNQESVLVAAIPSETTFV